MEEASLTYFKLTHYHTKAVRTNNAAGTRQSG